MRQQAGYSTLLLLFFTLSLSANHVDEYIQNYKDIAQREMKRSRIPASIIIAQGIHESSWGRGELARESKNHFGIKCKDYWTGPTYYIEDDDYKNGKLIKSCFRAYENVEASYIDHTDFLVDNERYKSLFSYSTTDYKNWAKGLKKCGYATDQNYASKLIRIIEEHKLYQFDTLFENIMEAPIFHIPEHFLNKEEDEVDPVIYTYEDVQVEPSLGVDVEEAQSFDYQVQVADFPKKEEEENTYEILSEEQTYRPIDRIRIEAYDNRQYDLTEVIPNKTSKDKKIHNLTRKPRMTGDAGPR